MKRLILYVLILAVVLLFPAERADVAKLRPVEVLAVYKAGNTVVLATDTEDIGRGPDVRTALENMRQTSPAVIYLDTAEYLLIGENAKNEVQALRGILKASTKLCATTAEVDLKEAAKYLPVHGELPRLREWKAEGVLPVLTTENDRIKLLENNEKALDN